MDDGSSSMSVSASKGGKASIGGKILDDDTESPVASELCLDLVDDDDAAAAAAATAADGNNEADNAILSIPACCGNSDGKIDDEVVESISSSDNVKSTDPFRLRNGFLPDGDDAALQVPFGLLLRMDVRLLLPAPVVIVDPFEVAIDNSND
jgi:hypothetical protein